MEENQHVIKNEIGPISRIDCDTEQEFPCYSLLFIEGKLQQRYRSHTKRVFTFDYRSHSKSVSRTFTDKDIEWKLTTVRCSRLNEHTIGIKCSSTMLNDSSSLDAYNEC